MSIKDLTDGWYIYTDQIPHLLLALLVLFFGWLVAKGMGKSVELALRKTDLDNKLFSNFGNRKYSIEFIIGKIVYYTLLIVVWIIFFNMLQLSLIAEPLVQMVSIMTAAIPNLLKAALILLFAWVVAMILRLLFKKGAAVFHLESRLVQWRMAKSELDADNKVDSVAKAIFYFVLLLFLPGVLGALQMEGISEPFANALSVILAFIPKFFAAALIVFIGWLVAKIVRDILTNFLKSTGIDKLGQRFGLIKNVEETSLSSIIGNIVFILILIPTIITALERLELKGIADPAVAMLQDVLTLIPNIVVAAILLVVGVWLGKWVEGMVVHEIDNGKQERDELERLATTDPLTGLYNHQHFFTLGEYAFEKSRRDNEKMTILLLDIDHFKRINDKFGHQSGDQALIDITRLITESVRKEDVCFRYGGEEFVFLLPRTSLLHGSEVAERIRLKIANHIFGKNQNTFSMTVSLGAAEAGQQDETMPALLERADRALYQAKNRGRNQTVSA